VTIVQMLIFLKLAGSRLFSDLSNSNILKSEVRRGDAYTAILKFVIILNCALQGAVLSSANTCCTSISAILNRTLKGTVNITGLVFYDVEHKIVFIL